MALMIFAGFAVQAQDSPPRKPPTSEERKKRTMEMVQREVQPSEKQMKEMDAVFTTFFSEAEKLRKDMPAAQPPPDPKLKASMDKLVAERDASVKKILTKEQYQKYETAAAKMRPPRKGERPEGGPPKQ